jgi:hypothetical protein
VQHRQHAQCFGATKDDLPLDTYFLQHFTFICAQPQDNHLHHLMQTSKHYHFQTFHGGKVKGSLIYYKEITVAPTDLQKQLVQWYQDTLCHPGMAHTEQIIR